MKSLKYLALAGLSVATLFTVGCIGDTDKESVSVTITNKTGDVNAGADYALIGTIETSPEIASSGTPISVSAVNDKKVATAGFSFKADPYTATKKLDLAKVKAAIVVASTVPSGVYTVTLTAKAGGATGSQALTLTVKGGSTGTTVDTATLNFGSDKHLTLGSFADLDAGKAGEVYLGSVAKTKTGELDICFLWNETDKKNKFFTLDGANKSLELKDPSTWTGGSFQDNKFVVVTDAADKAKMMTKEGLESLFNAGAKVSEVAVDVGTAIIVKTNKNAIVGIIVQSHTATESGSVLVISGK